MKPHELVQEYRDLRDKRAAINREAEDKVKVIDERLDKLEAAMLKGLRGAKQKNGNFETGRVHIEEEIKVKVCNAQDFRNWVRQNPEVGPDCMEARAVKKNLLPIMKESEDGLVPGISVDIRDRVRFSKPSTK